MSAEVVRDELHALADLFEVDALVWWSTCSADVGFDRMRAALLYRALAAMAEQRAEILIIVSATQAEALAHAPGGRWRFWEHVAGLPPHSLSLETFRILNTAQFSELGAVRARDGLLYQITERWDGGWFGGAFAVAELVRT